MICVWSYLLCLKLRSQFPPKEVRGTREALSYLEGPPTEIADPPTFFDRSLHSKRKLFEKCRRASNFVTNIFGEGKREPRRAPDPPPVLRHSPPSTSLRHALDERSGAERGCCLSIKNRTATNRKHIPGGGFDWQCRLQLE